MMSEKEPKLRRKKTPIAHSSGEVTSGRASTASAARRVLDSKNTQEPSFIHSPTPEDLEHKDILELQNLWRQNHAVLSKMLKEKRIPYFGLHGTSGDNYLSILNSPLSRFEVATYYETDMTSDFLYKLYDAAIYVTTYASKGGKLGQVVVFDLDLHDQSQVKNAGWAWEHLHPGSRGLELAVDSKDEAKSFEKLNDGENLLWRSDVSYMPSKKRNTSIGDAKLIGVIEMEQYKKYFPQVNDWTRHTLRQRFLAQEIIARTLQLALSRS